ncbi:CRISPR-associated endonuclease/helicase Cas3 [Candidatus Thermokryptus mobilis]|uniref:CRISPR-associated endonuclease/helicase Cas3 n=1 Tax=Candidatus Thermokryptus mobilis TaxID=1643428 RepID=A0A0S4NEN0_9BACT|nr:CRISPR-associated helicase Cas3' [Candidatus Thermokryptus mobilis]CUU09336.1 CRISPR-associated endonuclease/helicase Cas3 [Candidatus Thermokryptus mobilis]
MWKILAKTSPEKTLYDHIVDVLGVLSQLIKIYPRVPDRVGFPEFWDYVFYALYLHDFGKAAEGFQRSLSEGKKWGYRHEILSAGFVSLLDYDDEIKKIIALGIVSHHWELDNLKERYSTLVDGKPGVENYQNALIELEDNFGELVQLMKMIPDLSKRFIGKELGNFNLPSSVDELIDVFKFAIKWYLRLCDDGLDDRMRNALILMRGFVLNCDHIASAGDIKIPLLERKISEIIKFNFFRDVQIEAGRKEGSLILIAPTGYGKTEASLFWVERNQNENFTRRVFYILPYTASINDMFKRFVNYFGEGLVGMRHHRAGYFIYQSFRDRGYSPEEAKKFSLAFIDLNKKIYSQFKIMTHLQLIKEAFGVSGFEMRLAEIVDGLVIVDEVHSYDARTIALLSETLKILKKDFGVDVLIMSATFPKFLREIFEPIASSIVMASEENLRSVSRHTINLIDDFILNGLDRIKREISSGKRVLVVCNTVKRAQEIYGQLKGDAIGGAKLIHSRFALIDREKIERDLRKAQLLVGTQAIEVSLDIDFDVLFTDIAPIDRLIQRAGRVNRRGRLSSADVFVFCQYQDEDKKIYDKELIERTKKELEGIRKISEFDVIDLVERVYCDGFSEKQRKIFNDTVESFKRLRGSVLPMLNNKVNEDDFYRLVKSVEVVPYVYEEEYVKLIEEKRYFEAIRYFLPLAFVQFFKLRKNGQIYEHSKTLFCRAMYDEELGLLTDEFETNILE